MKKSNSAKDPRPTDAAPRAGPLPAIGIVVVAGLYLLWFVQAAPPRPGQRLPLRLALLNELRDPFGLIAEWFGPAGTPLGFLDRLPVLIIAALIIIAAIGLGRLVIEQLHLAPGITDLERIVFAAGAGLSGLSTIVLLVGLAGGLGQRWLLWLLVGGFAVLASWQFYRDQSSRLSRPPTIRSPQSALAWLSIPFVMMLLLGACLPPWDFDVREYHLQVPKEWLQRAQITFLPHNVYGNMPLGAEMHALLAMGLWPGEHSWFYGALAGKVVMGSFAVITGLGVASAGERLAGRAGGLLAAVVFLSHPWVIDVSVNGLNDGALACYVFLAFYAMWLARGGACSFLLPGLLAGVAGACKYPGLVFAAAPLAVWAMVPVGRVSNPSSEGGLKIRPALALALLIAGILAGGGAWYAKSAILAGNPAYPLAYRIFGGATRTPEKDAQWSKAHQVPPDDQGRRYSPSQLGNSLARIAGRDDLASPLILPLLAATGIAFFVSRRSPNPQSALRNPHLALLAALALVWIVAVWWLLSHRIDRFLLPAWPFAALLAAGAAWQSDRWWQWAVQTIVLVVLPIAVWRPARSSSAITAGSFRSSSFAAMPRGPKARHSASSQLKGS